MKNRVSKISLAFFSPFWRKEALSSSSCFRPKSRFLLSLRGGERGFVSLFLFSTLNQRKRPLLSTHRGRRSAAMMSSRKRKRLDDDIDALLLSSNASKRKNKKREKRLKRLDPSLHDVMGQRGVIRASSSL